MNSQELLKYWVEEREAIREKKEAGLPKPWSEDPIFQNTYFCNVRREDDRVTRWLRANWLADHANYEFAMVVARLINRPATLMAIEFPDVPLELFLDGVQDQLNLCASRGVPFWGNAYVVTTHGQRMDKGQYLIGLLRGAHNALPLAGVAGTCAAYHRALKTLEGFSDFMAAQVVADLKNTAFHKLAEAPDWWTFAAPGPGSLRGLAWYFELSTFRRSGFMEGLAEVRWGLEDMGCKHIHSICNQDLQNCLCEYDKYMRVLNGTGRSKRKYSGR
jgi:hypothetical protein